uniref:Uncharacterized protein n=1 Tax=Anopheles coluzzii TaxID=1518534 RepID=A0A8W7PJI0_ANOCL
MGSKPEIIAPSEPIIIALPLPGSNPTGPQTLALTNRTDPDRSSPPPAHFLERPEHEMQTLMIVIAERMMMMMMAFIMMQRKPKENQLLQQEHQAPPVDAIMSH